MPSTCRGVRLTAVVLISCFALCGCALQSSRPAVAAQAGGAERISSDGWRFGRTITLDTTASGANVTEDVENYPLAVLLDQSRFDFSQARADGADIRFFDSAGKALPHAIELWDRESGSAAIWVLLDVVKGNSKDQSIVMKWGHPSAPDISDSKAVFKRENGFVGVWHLGEDGNTNPDGYKDSSDHEAHGTGVGMIPGSRVDARIGKGAHLDNPRGQDTARWIRVSGEKASAVQSGPAHHGFDLGARSFVSHPQLRNDDLERRHLLDAAACAVRPRRRRSKDRRPGLPMCVRTPGYHLCAYNFAGQGLVTNEWLHFMVVLEEPGMKLYINGQLNASRIRRALEQGRSRSRHRQPDAESRWPAPVGRHSGRGARDAGRPQPELGEARLREPAGDHRRSSSSAKPG